MAVVKTTFGRLVEASFKPAPWLKNAHLQTILPKFVLSTPRIQFVNERVTTPDQDFIDLAWAMPGEASTLKATVVLFHGLEGSAESHYITHLVSALLTHNIGCVVMHFRGCSGEPNLRPIAYHSGATFDAEFIIPFVKSRYAHLPLFAVGFSLGANMLMKLMAKRDDLPIQASVCVSAPLDLAASSNTMQRGFARLYQYHLLKSMKRNLLHKMQLVDMSQCLAVSAQEIAAMRTFYEFDDRITAILHGFNDANDYYKQCSALPDLPLIKKPTLILHAQDDPFMDATVIPHPSLINRHVAYELSQYGGHVGFINGMSGSNKFWLATRIPQFLREYL